MIDIDYCFLQLCFENETGSSSPPDSTQMDAVADIPSEDEDNGVTADPPPYSTGFTTSTPPSSASAWYPAEWLHRSPRAISPTSRPSMPQQSWPSIARSPSQSKGAQTKGHMHSQSEPITTHVGLNVRQTRSSSESSTSTQSSSQHHLQKSILQRTSSTLTTRTVKSAKSVKFVDTPEVFYDCDDEEASFEEEICSGRGRWRSALKRFILGHPLGKRIVWFRKQEPPKPQRPEISGPYPLFAASCPTLPFAGRDKDAASIRSFKSTYSGRERKRRVSSNADVSWVGSKLGSLFRSLVAR